MSSYFDSIRRQVAVLSRECPNTPAGTEAFLFGLMRIEKAMIEACELFAGDVETPEDTRRAIMDCIHCNEVRYEGGDMLGSHIAGVFIESRGAQVAACSRSSRLESEMHSLWHDIARMRYQMRYGLVWDNPEAAVAARDAFSENRKHLAHPWQKKPATAGNAPLKFSDYQPPKTVREHRESQAQTPGQSPVLH
jgi:hypothetical protein